MSKEYQAQFTRSGSLMQSAIPKKQLPKANLLSSQGLLFRGVVLATYVSDDINHPFIDSEQPVAIYCDVLTYSNVAGVRNRFIRQALVLQDKGAMHSGRIWKPRAATIDMSGNALDPAKGTEPSDMDGDHVLVGFMHNQLFEPIILGGLPHPNADTGNENRQVGRRIKLKLTDGDPDFWKHHGSFYGVDTDGGFEVDTRFANDGSLTEDGKEKLPADANGSGFQVFRFPADAFHKFEMHDVQTDPDNPQLKASISFDANAWRIRFEDEQTEILVEPNAITIDTEGGANPVRVTNGEIQLGGDFDNATMDSLVQEEMDIMKGEIDDLAGQIETMRYALPLYIPPLIPNFGKPIDECVESKFDPITLTNPLLSGKVKPGSSPIDIDGQANGPPFPITLLSRTSGLAPTKSELVKIKENP